MNILKRKVLLKPLGITSKPVSGRGVRLIREEIFTFPYLVDPGLHAFPPLKR